jgi:hypothetical protein
VAGKPASAKFDIRQMSDAVASANASKWPPLKKQPSTATKE